MWEVLSDLRGEDLIGIVAVGGGMLLALAIVSMNFWFKHRDRELAVTIIQDMLDQGMSSEQIERVLTAAGFDGDSTARTAARHKVQAIRDKITQNVT